MSLILSEETKKKIVHFLTSVLLDNIEKAYVTDEDGREIARYILDRKDKLYTQEDITTFVSELSKKWSLFESVKDDVNKQITMENSQENMKAEDVEKIDAIQKQLVELGKFKQN